ncbi:L-type lectin-domain containing receptor kinase IX.1-like [Olea europaea var. sylvestris]|uniref:L-type lectin-domain containing receptor kinase IX.1-like n=1 Tax=Olea europaea var. sylvestris TaxID=158386 RepID=UPI000C1D6448|nr:L-type lectin-domain containing receptor kinase IX.1-like [Olea europaea var. sylvestris]
MLKIDVAYAGNPLVNFLNHKIILKDTVPREVYVGFTASSGHFSEIHQVLDWSFTLYELPNESLDEGIALNKCKRAFEFVIPISVVLLLAVMPFVLKARRRRKERLGRREDIEMQTKLATNVPKKFTYKELSKATRNFSKENLLGTGGFGSVYKGVFTNSDYPSPIAVKKINATSTQGEREYLAEISTIGRLRHKNLVQLQGWCHDREQLLLVYEYMPNGSLDRYIGKEFLDWKIRYKILSGLASVLHYLHEECGNPVVHRDVKPNNVMLDSEYNAHLGDFGLARLLHNNAFVTTMVAGTIGYLAPEVSYTGRATPESDVYSFGIVVLEVVCGRRSKGIMEDDSLVDYVWSAYEKGSLLSCVDKMLKGDFEEEQVQRTLIIGLACLHPDQMLRPRMQKVVQIFMNPYESIVKLPESRPDTVCLSFLSSSSHSTTTHGAKGLMECSPVEMTVLYDSCNIGEI